MQYTLKNMKYNAIQANKCMLKIVTLQQTWIALCIQITLFMAYG